MHDFIVPQSDEIKTAQLPFVIKNAQRSLWYCEYILKTYQNTEEVLAEQLIDFKEALNKFN